ncbi:hypothetical protein DFH28DRAFT_1161937 [Melampsora americana]|nr:hypothetical protein DFH28DRAFT_1161937 [Melampsora americana]
MQGLALVGVLSDNVQSCCTQHLTKNQNNYYQSGIPADAHRATSQGQLHHPPNQPNFHHTGFISVGQQSPNHGHLHERTHIPSQHVDQHHQAQQAHQKSYNSSYHEYETAYNNYDNPCYPAGLTVHSQANNPHVNSILQLKSDPSVIQPLVQASNAQSTPMSRNPHTNVVCPANHLCVPLILALESHPSVIQLSKTQSTQLSSHTNAQNCDKGHCCHEAPIVHESQPKIDPTSTTTTTSTQAQMQEPTPTTPAIVNLFLPNSLKGVNDALQGLPSNLQTPEDMMQKPLVKLQMLAAKHAKGSTVLPSNKNLFLPLYKEFNKVLAINCINNQVSVSENCRGGKAYWRGPKKYQQLCMINSGLANGAGSKLVLIIWNTKSKAEQDSYKVENQTLNSTSSNSITPVLHADANNAQAKNWSLTSVQVAVDRFMIKLQIESNNMAATYLGDFAMIGVSDHLGDDAYQIVQATPHALKSAQLQAFVTATKAGLLNLSKVKVYVLSTLLSLRTKGTTNEWLWKGFKEKPDALGYFVQFAPDLKSQAGNIMQDSN